MGVAGEVTANWTENSVYVGYGTSKNKNEKS